MLYKSKHWKSHQTAWPYRADSFAPKLKEYGKLKQFSDKYSRLFGKTDFLEHTAITFRKKLLKTTQLHFWGVSYSIYLTINYFKHRCTELSQDVLAESPESFALFCFYKLQMLDLALDLLDHNLQGMGLRDLCFQKALQLILIKTLAKIYWTTDYRQTVLYCKAEILEVLTWDFLSCLFQEKQSSRPKPATA